MKCNNSESCRVIEWWTWSLCSCMRSLRDPLLDAELNQKRKSTLWHFASEIMVWKILLPSLSVKSASNSISIWLYIFNAVAHQRTLHAIHESLSELLFFNSLRKHTKSDNIQSKESMACVAYLLFVQRITIDRFPSVFRWDSISKIWSDSLQIKQHLVSICCSPVFVLQCNMEHISLLLSRSGNYHQIHGFSFPLLTISWHRFVFQTAKRSHMSLKEWWGWLRYTSWQAWSHKTDSTCF